MFDPEALKCFSRSDGAVRDIVLSDGEQSLLPSVYENHPSPLYGKAFLSYF